MPFALLMPLLCVAVTVEAEAAKGILSAEAGVACYQRCVRQAILVGGCNASRALFAGACAAAVLQRLVDVPSRGVVPSQEDFELVIPPTWVAQLAETDKLVEMGKKLTALN